MADFGFKIIPKKLFFDGAKVMATVEKGKRDALSKIGSYVMTVARNATSKKANSKRKTAKAGQPPLQHVGLLHDKIFFAYNPRSGSVVIGPERAGTGIAELLEKGGKQTLTRHIDSKYGKAGEKYVAVYKGNPFMVPSLNASIKAGKVAEAWRGVVRV